MTSSSVTRPCPWRIARRFARARILSWTGGLGMITPATRREVLLDGHVQLVGAAQDDVVALGRLGDVAAELRLGAGPELGPLVLVVGLRFFGGGRLGGERGRGRGLLLRCGRRRASAALVARAALAAATRRAASRAFCSAAASSASAATFAARAASSSRPAVAAASMARLFSFKLCTRLASAALTSVVSAYLRKSARSETACPSAAARCASCAIMVQSSAGTRTQASSHWFIRRDVMSGLRAVGLQSDAFGNGAQDLISAMIFWRSQNVREDDRPATQAASVQVT